MKNEIERKMVSLIQDAMTNQADELTAKANSVAFSSIEVRWQNACEGLRKYVKGDQKSENYIAGEMFKKARVFIENRTADIRAGLYKQLSFAPIEELCLILRFDFVERGVVAFEWNGTSVDPLDANSFYVYQENREHPRFICYQHDIQLALTEFVKEGAVCAKKIGSDTYDTWAALLVDLTYDYDSVRHESEKLWNRVDAAAKRLAIDNTVFEVIAHRKAENEPLQSTPPCKQKRAKNEK